MRWYLGLHGEDSPKITAMECDSNGMAKPIVYRYDWVFGISLIEGHYWNWQNEIDREGPLAIHVVLQAVGDAPEAIPLAGVIRALHPSRNTKGFLENFLEKIPAGAASAGALAAKAGESLHPLMGFVAEGLSLASNTLASQDKGKKNWFLYQFLDEQLKAPTVEWRINKDVLKEYGSLLRGSLFLAFNGSSESSGFIRIKMRPQLSYCQTDDISFMIPTDELRDDQQVSIDVKPRGSNIE
jgi:hypothetical protein